MFARIPKAEADILIDQMKSINVENKSTEELRLNMLSILAKKFTLSEFKPYIREMAGKNYFRLIQDYALYRIVEDIEWDPWPTSLQYMQENPKLTISFDINPENVKKSMKELEEYRDELLEEVMQESKDIIADEEKITDRVIGSYTHSEKIKIHEARKNIYEALTIAALINQLMEPQILTINNKKLELVKSNVSPYGFLQNRQPYTSNLKNLLKSQ